jgi:hypothetical protein
MTAISPPLGIVCELTHRCPLQCPYCSNPLELARAGAELGTDAWLRVLDEAAALGVLHVHFSGGEPTARKDLPELVRRASANGLYTNLITAGVLLDEAAIEKLKAAGIDHIQLSFQDVIAESGDRVAGLAGAHTRKLAVAAAIRQAGLPLTLNFVVHRRVARRRAHRDCACAILWLGAGESGSAAAKPGSARVYHQSGARSARATERKNGHRLRGARLLRASPESVHGRLGTTGNGHYAFRQGDAVPCGGFASGFSVPFRDRYAAGRDLE